MDKKIKGMEQQALQKVVNEYCQLLDAQKTSKGKIKAQQDEYKRMKQNIMDTMIQFKIGYIIVRNGYLVLKYPKKNLPLNDENLARLYVEFQQSSLKRECTLKEGESFANFCKIQRFVESTNHKNTEKPLLEFTTSKPTAALF